MASQGLAEDSQANLGSMNSTGSKRRMKGKSTRNVDGAGPKGRPAGRANRGVIDEIQKRLEDFVPKEEYQKLIDEQTRVMASITVFKSQMKLFERKIMDQNNTVSL